MPVSARAVYYPVFQLAPVAGNEAARGYDLGSEPTRREALESAIRSEQPTGTNPITLVQEAGNQKGMPVFRPVFDSGSPHHLRGFAVAVLRMGNRLMSAAPNDSVLLELSLLRKDAVPELLAASWGVNKPRPCGDPGHARCTRGKRSFPHCRYRYADAGHGR